MNRLALLEIGAVFFLLEIRIWLLGKGWISWPATLLPLIPILWHWYKNPHEFKDNFRPAGTRNDYLILGFVFLFFWRAIGLAAEIWNPDFWNQPAFLLKFGKRVLPYFFWAFFQQLCLCGYFVNRLNKMFNNPRRTTIVSGILFAIVHLPNPVLVPATLIGGLISAHLFQKTRNLYLLALLHAILAVMILYALPVTWHHHLRIGPGFYRWEP